MFMNIASDGSFRQYAVAIMPGQPMESSAVPSGTMTTTVDIIGEKIPDIDWDRTLPPIEISETQLV